MVAGQDAEKVSALAKQYRELMGGSYVKSYAWIFGEISDYAWGQDSVRPKRTIAKPSILHGENIQPGGAILGLRLVDPSQKDSLIEKRKRKIESAEETLRFMEEHGLNEMHLSNNKWSQSKNKEDIESEIAITSEEIEKLESEDFPTQEILEYARFIGEQYGLPLFDLDGNLLWPKQMSYEEVKAFVAERDDKKAQESAEAGAPESSAEEEK
jgi:hypothetical protein